MSIKDDLLLGGPGLDGYAYRADVYCVACGRAIIEAMSEEAILAVPADLRWDTDYIPQPAFFSESDTAEYCASCFKRLDGRAFAV